MTTRIASAATTTANPHNPTAANTSTGLRGSRASRYSPSHQLNVNTSADSAAMNSVWHGGASPRKKRQRP
ncbi:hypothetical protein C1Y40_00952 [Mycobacterium talmoniae]|uniref:Uncharacterized protein n=1 Tax=Mycobacterium talmoniae TaxID=1858794 RepID=A0A2S8BQ97_9MYCO|nr:hypothetical protein C1Y40_00952 [Mycobacterium talmoniae]